MTTIMAKRMDSGTQLSGSAIYPITIVLPAAPPQIYLRWLRWWRTSERRTRDWYEGADLVSRLALAPHPSSLFWDPIAQDVSRQAGRGKALGRPMVMPRIRATNLVLALGIGYMDRRQRFLEYGIAEHSAMRVARPDAEFVQLRSRIVHDAARQLAASARSRAASRRSVASPRPRDVRRPVRAPAVRGRARTRSRSHASHNPGQAA